MNPSKLSLTSLIPISVVLLAFTHVARAENITFKAGDNLPATQLCVAAVNNDVTSTINHIKSISLQSGKYLNHKIKSATRNVSCNGMNLVAFTAKYNATETFMLLNKSAIRKYKIDDSEVSIHDIASANTPSIITVTSK